MTVVITEKPMMSYRIASKQDTNLDRFSLQQAKNQRYQALVAAVVDLAAREAQYQPQGMNEENRERMTSRAIAAREWLASPDCAFYLQALGIERGPVIAWLDQLPEIEQTDLTRKEGEA